MPALEKGNDAVLTRILNNPKRVDPRSFSSGSEFYGAAVGMVDGDGASLKLADGKIVNVRLAYGDAHETEKKEGGKVVKPGQPYGDKAASHLDSLIKGKNLTMRVTEPASGKNFWRPVVEVYADGVNVNKEMFKAGFYSKQKRGIPLEYWDAASQGEINQEGMYREKTVETAAEFRARMFPGMLE